LSDEQVASILGEIGISTLITSTIIGTGAVLAVFWVSSRISFNFDIFEKMTYTLRL